MNDTYLHEDGGSTATCQVEHPDHPIRCTLLAGHRGEHCHQSFALTKPKDILIAVAGEIRW